MPNLKERILFGVFLFLLSFVTIGQTRTSVNNGNFTTPGTWDCNCVPGTSNNIVISAGDTVLLTANTTVVGVEIKSTGQLDNNGRRIEIFGNYIVNGQHTGSGDIWLRGLNTYMDGTGFITNGNDVEIRNNGIHTLSTASITKDGGGTFRIIGATTFTNNGTIITSRNIFGNNAASTFRNTEGASLYAGRAIFATVVLHASDSGNTVYYDRLGAQTIIEPASSYYNLTISGTGNKTISNNTLVDNDLTLNGGSFRANGNTLEIKGDFINSGGQFVEGSSTVVFNGSENQHISVSAEELFNNLTVNKASGDLILDGDAAVSNTLTLSGGNLDATNHVLSLGTSATSIGLLSRTSGYVKGTFSRWINTGTTVYLFPVGDDLAYNPANLTFTTVVNGKMNVRYIPAFPTSVGLPLNEGGDTLHNTFSEGYWRIKDTSGVSGSVYNLQLTANGFSSYSINASTRLVSRLNPSASWSLAGSNLPASSPNVFRNAISTWPLEFTLADTTKCTIPSPNTSSISGLSAVCKGATSVMYSVLETPGSTYNWSVNGGNQIGSGNGDSILVDWGNNGFLGSVSVIEYNGCEYGSPVSLNVDIQPFEPVQIFGQNAGFEGTSGNLYFVEEKPGYTYNWIVSGVGSRQGSGSNDSILVDFSTAGLAKIELSMTNACGTSDTIFLNVTVSSTIKSISSGNWTSGTTWDCACNPGNNSSVNIRQGHTVTSTVNGERVYAIVIDSAGSLVLSNNIRVSSNLSNNGSVTGAGEVRMNTTGSVLGGTGSWSGFSGNLRFMTGSHSILSDVIMIKTGNIQLNNNAFVFNEGYIETPGTMTGGASSSWEQVENSTLKIGNINWATGSFDASAIGNHVIYSSNGTFTRNVRYPVSGTYYDLTINGNNVNGIYRIITGNLTAHDINLTGGRLDANTSNFGITLDGNWNNTGGLFNARAGQVTFTGANASISHATIQNFYRLNISTGVGNVFANCSLLVQNQLNITAGSILDLNVANNNQLNVQGDVFNNGLINFYEGRFFLNGAVLQNLNGTLNTYDLTIDNLAGVEIDAGMSSVRNVLDILSGQLNTKNNMTFVSTASGTAALDDLTGGGSIIGDVIVQRYLNEAASNRFYMLGSQVSGATIADWASDLTTYGFPGATYPSHSFKSIYKYDIAAIPVNGNYSLGYVTPSGTTESLGASQGWMVWHSGGPVTVDVVGPLTTGPVVSTLDYNANPSVVNQRGWNLKSNPYAAPINWASVTKVNVSAGEAYVSKPDGNYWAVSGDNINYIYSGEGFWVKSNVGGGSVVFQESHKSIQNDDYNSRQAAPAVYSNTLKMELTYQRNAKYMDYAVLRFGGDSNTVNYDNVYGEAIKVPNSYGNLPNIATYSVVNNTNVYYNNLNPQDSNMTIPIFVGKTYPDNRNEQFNIEFNGIEQWVSDNHCLILTDSLNNLTKKLDGANSSYAWTARDTFSKPYLYLNHSIPLEVLYSNPTCYGEMDGSISVQGKIGTNHDYVWVDAMGDTIKIELNITGISSMNNLSSGIYRVWVSDNGQCSDMAATVVLHNPDPIVSKFNAPTTSVLNASPVQFLNESQNANTYLWSFGDGLTSVELSPTHHYAAAGKYTVELQAFQNTNCFAKFQKEIEIIDVTGIQPKAEQQLIEAYSFERIIYMSASFEEKENISVNVFDILGQSVFEAVYQGVNNLNEQIHLNAPSGVYFIRIQSTSVLETHKLMIQ